LEPRGEGGAVEQEKGRGGRRHQRFMARTRAGRKGGGETSPPPPIARDERKRLGLKFRFAPNLAV
ncbi:MAG: hypothetical protein WAU78_14005, partial [Roseiarcus sp.]